jgi:hypothetical protein
MARGFIDGATITSALTYLNLGRYASAPVWHTQSILETTYLLLHDNIHIITRPKGIGGEIGDYAIAASEFRELIFDSGIRKRVLRKTFSEAADKYPFIKEAWEDSRSNEAYLRWAEVQRYDRWENQSFTYGALFDFEAIPIISKVTGYTEQELLSVQRKSSDPNTVKRWAKASKLSSEAMIAEAAWLIGGYVRGFFYSKLAAAEGLQLLSHPFRRLTEENLGIGEQHHVTNSEEALVKILVANALTELTSKRRRINVWATSVNKVRHFIRVNDVEFLDTTQPEAEEHAIRIAKKIGLQAAPRELRWLIDSTLGLSLAGCFHVAPWFAVPAFLGYRMIFGKTPGEHVGDLALKSTYQFEWLARSIPGRIERGLSDHLQCEALLSSLACASPEPVPSSAC